MSQLIIVSVLLLASCLAIQAIPAVKPLNEFPIIETDTGSVQGYTISTGIFSRFVAFKGIPFGAPPVGNLRFADPIPHPGWEGVRDASEHGPNCAQGSSIGEEDCLSINVYAPSLIGVRPVMVWVHGGAFSLGSGDSSMYGADHLVQDDVVIVTFNYRLGALGFLSTGDRHAPGNYAMKDMQLALKWVQRNILAFGGDPNSVTVFGESAGGVAVHLLVLSPLSEGLFHKAIAQSGSVLSPWGFAIDPRSWAFDLADRLGITATSTEDLIAQLRQLPAHEISSAHPGLLEIEIPRGFQPFSFVPCVDPADSLDPIFMPRHPREMMETGDFMHIPFIIGQTDAESLFIIRESFLDRTVIDQLNENTYAMIPYAWNITRGSPEAASIAQEFRDFYLDGEMLSSDNLHEWSKYTTDHHFGYGIDISARLHAQNQAESVYYYVFSFVGNLNFMKRALFLTDLPGAVHADELAYMFSMTDRNLPMLPSNPALLTRRRLVRLWTNFAKTSNPTAFQNTDVNVDWLPYGDNEEYLEIGDALVPGNHANAERMSFWHDLRNRYQD